MAGKQKLKIGINNVVSWGATVVIIGLLFKIQHWPYATFFITLGLGTEALLFLLLGFQSEPIEVDWTRVYPELAGEAAAPVAITKGATPASLPYQKWPMQAPLRKNLQPNLKRQAQATIA
jgi:gliding motility-associated protein GldL